MKSIALVLCLAAAVAAHAQSAAKTPAPAAAKPATSAAKSGAAAKSGTAARTSPAAAAASAIKYPPGVKPDPSIKKTLIALRYQDLKIGTGAEAEPMKLYTVKYTGWRAADGVVFDSWDQHPVPVQDKDGKNVMGEDGKPKMGDPQPAKFPVGMGRMIPGFDQGFTGMKVGGKRRLFIPWQLAYGARAMPDRGPDHPGIPAKSDLVFDVELVSIADLPAPPAQAAPRPQSAPSTASPAPSGSAPSTPPPTSQPSTPPPSSQPSTPPPSVEPK